VLCHTIVTVFSLYFLGADLVRAEMPCTTHTFGEAPQGYRLKAKIINLHLQVIASSQAHSLRS
jgi:hypothetical protein